MQSVLLPVPAADPLVDRFRLQGDWSRVLGVPAHVTLAGPFPLSLKLPIERLAALARDAAGTRFRLSEIGRVGDATCLLVADQEPLAALRGEMLDAIGRARQVDASWTFHLTVSRGASATQEAALREALRPSLPLECEVEEIVVAALRDDELQLSRAS